MFVKTLPVNTKGRDFVVGDIHGHFALLESAMKTARFDPVQDRLISAGDMINRGPDSKSAIGYLRQEWFHAVRGNHEQMFLDEVDANGRIEDDEFLYLCGMEWIKEMETSTLKDWRPAFDAIPYAIKIETADGDVGVVHASVPREHSWDVFFNGVAGGNQMLLKRAMHDRSRIVGPTRDDAPIDGVSRVFHGHTRVTGGPLLLSNRCYIDTGAGKIYTDNTGLTLCDIKARDDAIQNAVFVNRVCVVLAGP